MSITIDKFILPVSKMGRENPLPVFRALEDTPVKDGGLLPEELPGLSDHTAFRVLPYRMQDLYDSTPSETSLTRITLENEFLRAEFLPELGGRLYSLWSKRLNKELLFKNPALRIGNLALRNAWFSGGIEWNFGHFGHTFLTCSPLFFAEGQDADGNAFLRMYEYERCKSLFFQFDFHLPPGADHLTAHMRFINPHDRAIPFFYWTNIALTQTDGCRAFSGTDQVVFLKFEKSGARSAFAHGEMPFPAQDGVDYSFPARIAHSEEYFYQNAPDSAYEALAYEDNTLFWERSSGNMPYRKVFTWGNHRGGRHWQDHLSLPGKGDYLEIQGGFYRTQMTTELIRPRETIAATQVFGALNADYQALSGDFTAAQLMVRDLIEARCNDEMIQAEHEKYAREAEKPADKILHFGSGWGALEQLRAPEMIPAPLIFPPDSMGEEQAPWEELLRGKPFRGAAEFMTTPEWLGVLQSAAERQADNAKLKIHVGIALNENERQEEAFQAWMDAISLDRNDPLPYRNIAFIQNQRGKIHDATLWMEKAVQLLRAPERAYAEEYLALLCEAENYRAAFAFYRSLPLEMQALERLSISASIAAFELGEDEFLEEQFERAFASIKEGEVRFTGLWFRLQARKEALKKGVPFSEALVREMQTRLVIPEHLDFRMFDS